MPAKRKAARGRSVSSPSIAKHRKQINRRQFQDLNVKHVRVPRPKKTDSSVAREILKPPTQVLLGHEEFRASKPAPKKTKHRGPIKLYVIEKEVNPEVIEQLKEQILEEEEPAEYIDYQRSRLAEITHHDPLLRQKLHRAHQQACGLEVPESAESRSLATYLTGNLRPIGKMS